jgi:DNA-binding LacI/PurR family transcriptional regulator
MAMTIRDIAKLTNVSTATVSKVINNKCENISDETKQRILKVIQEHNYIPYQKVADRFSQQSNTVALLITDVSDIFGSELLRGVEDYFFARNFSVIIGSTDNDAEKEKKYIHMLQKQLIRGIIHFSSPVNSLKKTEPSKQSAIFDVVLNDYKNSPDALKTYFNNREGGKIAVRHLIEAGHRRIGYITPKKQLPYLEERSSGYWDALEEAHIPRDMSLVFAGSAASRRQCGYEGIQYLLSKNISAVFCCDDHVAVGAYRAIQEKGLHIPGDISVIGFDDSFLCEILDPPLSSIKQSAYEIGKTGAEILYAKISGLPLAKTSVEIQPELIRRKSVAQPDSQCKSGKPCAVIVGEIRADMIMDIQGQTNKGRQTAGSMRIEPGGKAVYKAREKIAAGGEVYLIGCLGNESNGHLVFEALTGMGFRLEGVQFRQDVITGTAFITCSKNGVHNEVIYSGANDLLDEKCIQENSWIFHKADRCFMDNNINSDAVKTIRSLCQAYQTDITEI